MSSETASTDESSRYLNGKDCQGRAGTRGGTGSPKSSAHGHRVGGVSGGGGMGRGDGISCETCRGAASPEGAATIGTTPSMAKAERTAAGVGDLHSSVEAPDSITGAERREGTRANAHQRSEGTERRWPGMTLDKNVTNPGHPLDRHDEVGNHLGRARAWNTSGPAHRQRPWTRNAQNCPGRYWNKELSFSGTSSTKERWRLAPRRTSFTRSLWIAVGAEDGVWSGSLIALDPGSRRRS